MAFTAFQSNAFQNNAFQTIDQHVPQPGDGFGRAGYYRRPIKYVRDGQVVDLNERPAELEIAQPVPLTPAMIEALFAQAQRTPVSDPLAGRVAALDDRMGRMLIEQELAAMEDDDLAVLLLLSS